MHADGIQHTGLAYPLRRTAEGRYPRPQGKLRHNAFARRRKYVQQTRRVLDRSPLPLPRVLDYERNSHLITGLYALWAGGLRSTEKHSEGVTFRPPQCVRG